MDNLIHDSPQPLYHQIFTILRSKIMKGEWKPGDMIPAEPELMEQFQVSRTTIRQSLDWLVSAGLIYRQRGRGSFVAAPKIAQNLNQGVRFTEHMRQAGIEPETQILDTHLTPASDQTAIDLKVDLNEPLAIIDRLRLVNREPIGIQSSILVHRLCRDILQYDFARDSLYDVLEKSYGIKLGRVKQVVQAVAASASLAEHLKISSGMPLLYIERISCTQDGTPLELFRAHYRSDRYALHTEFDYQISQ